MPAQRRAGCHLEVSLDSILDHDQEEHDPAPNERWLSTCDLNLEGVANRQILERAFARVPHQYRKVLRLRFWEGMSMDEIQVRVSAEEQESVSIAAVKSRVHRGRYELMKRVEQIL